MTFDGKVAIVTGGASGIGGACVKLLAARGARVAALDVDEAAGLALADAVYAHSGSEVSEAGKDDEEDDGSRRVRFLRVDVADATEVTRAIDEVHARWGRIDILVASAGIQRYGTATTTTDDEWTRVLDVNLTGAWHAARACLRHMTRGSAIVNVSSVQGLATQRNVCAYTVSKHGLIGLTRSLAVDFAAAGIRANAVCPGSVDTPMLRWTASLDPEPSSVLDACRDMHPLGRIAEPAEIAEVICFLAHERASFVTGGVYTVDGGLLSLLGGAPRTEG
jgi:NAD(P)-dependent dehydrogenase (short-subunit alcohol dehydrogenase family)